LTASTRLQRVTTVYGTVQAGNHQTSVANCTVDRFGFIKVQSLWFGMYISHEGQVAPEVLNEGFLWSRSAAFFDDQCLIHIVRITLGRVYGSLPNVPVVSNLVADLNRDIVSPGIGSRREAGKGRRQGIVPQIDTEFVVSTKDLV
jgi:hypothetical protein